jgi:phosphocarrier protein HPr
MTERTFTLANSTGLHARPATMLVQTANKFNGTNVFLKKGEKEVSGRSLLAILSLGAGAGETLTIRTDGPQEKEAMDALIALLEGGLGE